MLGTDNYNTSLQSLMKPVGSINANIGGYGLGYGVGSNGYMGGMMTPMSQYGVGQFTADAILGNDNKNNNYYTRPVPQHAMKDETGTILGILGAALGTVALLAACKNGKKFSFANIFRRRRPAPGPAPAPAPGPAPAPAITNPAQLLGYNPNPQGVNGNVLISQNNKALTGQCGTKPGTQFQYTGNNPVHPGTNQGSAPVTTNSDSITHSGTPSSKGHKVNWKDSAVDVEFIEIGGAKGLLGAGSNTPTNNVAGLSLSGQPQLQPLQSYLNNGNRTFNLGTTQQNKGLLPAGGQTTTSPSNVAGLLPQSTSTQAAGEFIRPVITRKGNRFANVSGQLYQAKFAPYGLSVDTQAFAKLPKTLHREFNNIVLNGTDAQLKAITCDPRFEQVFRLA